MPLPIVIRCARTVRIVPVLLVCLASGAAAATLEVGPGKPFLFPSDAAVVAHDGDHIVIAAGSYSDCAVWKANNLTIDGAGPNATVITGQPCAGKALFVADGNGLTVRDLALNGAHVGDFNGAGIRAEGGDLTVSHVRFADDEDGILSSPLPGKSIIVRDSEFIGDGTCAGGGGCAHGVYAGHIGLLRVERSRFIRTHEGHDIKSRADVTEVIGCDMADGASGTSSYAVDVTNGGGVVIRDNHIEKGPDSQNHTAAIMIGEEGVDKPTPEIIVSHNTFRVDGGYSSYLVYNLTATPAVLTGNILQGNAMALHGDGSVK